MDTNLPINKKWGNFEIRTTKSPSFFILNFYNMVRQNTKRLSRSVM